MKKFFLAVLVLCAFSVAVKADDVADAKDAFGKFIEYQKTDDERLLDLFAPDCAATLTFDTGSATKVITLPGDVFRGLAAQKISQKRGSKDQYENVQYKQDGATVVVTSTMVEGRSGKRGPFEAVYGRGAGGAFKIKALKVTLPVDQLPGGQ